MSNVRISDHYDNDPGIVPGSLSQADLTWVTEFDETEICFKSRTVQAGDCELEIGIPFPKDPPPPGDFWCDSVGIWTGELTSRDEHWGCLIALKEKYEHLQEFPACE